MAMVFIKCGIMGRIFPNMGGIMGPGFKSKWQAPPKVRLSYTPQPHKEPCPYHLSISSIASSMGIEKE